MSAPTVQPWRVSFGSQYRPHIDTHPTYPKADANGYVTIMAVGEEQARNAAFVMFGSAWSFLYPPDAPMDLDYWPYGEIERFDAEEVLGR